MANILGISTAVVLALSAFVAFKNKQAYTNELEKDAQAVAALEKNKSTLADRENELSVLPDDLAAVEAESSALKKQEEDLKKSLDEQKALKEQKAAAIESNKAKLNAIREQSGQLGDIKGLVDQLKTADQEQEALAEQVAAAEAQLANLTAQSNQAQQRAEALKANLERIANNESSANLRTSVRSYYPAWGFVTLSGGGRAGVVAKSTLDVVRDGQTIAKLLVTSVETSSASASVIPDTMAPDVTIQAGDLVVPGSKVPKPAILTPSTDSKN
ncbi:MAG: hypothetical protein QM627_01855 [Luteolibacter sp.]